MLRFAVFTEAGSAREWPLRQAYLVGPDDLPTPGDVYFEDSMIVCERRSEDPVGLALQYSLSDVSSSGPSAATSEGRVGVVTLQTCLLQQREKPYLLSLELARHSLMTAINKLEEWALFDLPPDDPIVRLHQRAEDAFMAALADHAVDSDAPRRVASSAGERSGGKGDRSAAGGSGAAVGGGVVGGGGGRGDAALYTAAGDALARRALELAVELGERLALRQSQVLFPRRVSGDLARQAEALPTPANALTDHEARVSRGAMLGSVGVILSGPPSVGMSVNPAVLAPALTAAAAGHDFIRLPMRWIDMEPTEGKYSFAKTDRWIEWAVREAKTAVHAGPLVEFSSRSVPDWLYIWEHDYETLRELVFEHVKNIVTRYRRTVSTWTVCGGLHVSSNFSLSPEQVIDLTRICTALVKKLQPNAKVQAEVSQPWGEYFADTPKAIPPLLYCEMLTSANVPIDAVGLRLQMGQAEPGRATRDLMSLSALLDRYGALDKPVAVTALGAPSEPPSAEAMGPGRHADPGCWRRPWSPEAQARWLAAAAAVVAAKPFVQSICWQDLYDMQGGGGAEMPAGGILTGAGQPKPAAKTWLDVRKLIRDAGNPASLVSEPA